MVGRGPGEVGEKPLQEAHLGEEDQVVPLPQKPLEHPHAFQKPPAVDPLGPLGEVEGRHVHPVRRGRGGLLRGRGADVPLLDKAAHPAHPHPRRPGQGRLAFGKAQLPQDLKDAVQLGIGVGGLQGHQHPRASRKASSSSSIPASRRRSKSLGSKPRASRQSTRAPSPGGRTFGSAPG